MVCGFIGWCELPLEAQAAWAQAILSVLGIGVAVAIPAWQQRMRRIEERAAIAKRTFIVRQLLMASLESMLETVLDLAAHYRIALADPSRELLIAEVDEILHHGILYESFRGYDDELQLLDAKAAQLTLQVIRKASQYRTKHASVQSSMGDERLRRFKAASSSLVTLLEEIKDAASRANMILRKDHERAIEAAKGGKAPTG